MGDEVAVPMRSYLFDISKIVEGAANSDNEKVRAYCQQLSDKLEAAGESEGAKRLRQILGQSKAQKFGLARANGGTARLGQSPPPSALPVDSESRLTVADEAKYEPSQVELYLAPEVQTQLDQFIRFMRAADRLVAHGVGISGSMLIYGPPGSGKTQLAKYTAAALGLPLITARMDGLISSYLGSTAKNLRMLFDHAASRPCVLFLDEFDALAKMRDDAKELGELKRVVISLLQNIDALGSEHVLLAATNHEHLLDPAIWRRFTYKLHLALPDRAVRGRMLVMFLRDFADPDAVEVLAAMSDGLSGAELKQMSENAIRDAILACAAKIDLSSTIAAFIAATRRDGSESSSVRAQLIELRRLDRKTFTQAKLAAIYGLSQSQISKLLNGAE